MQDGDIDWFVVFSQDEHLSEYTGASDRYIRALTGFSGSAGTLLVGADEAYLWTDSRYFIQANAQLEGSGISLMKYGMPDVPSLEDFLSGHIWEGQRLAFDHRTLSYDHLDLIRKKLGAGVDTVDGACILRALSDSMPKRDPKEIVSVPESASGKSTKDKLAALRRRINRVNPGIDSYTYIISDLTNIMWLFNLRGSDIAHVPVAYSYALITSYSATLYVNRKMLDDETKEALADDVLIKEYSLFYKDLEDVATDIVLADRYTCNARICASFDENGVFRECNDTELIPKALKNEAETSGMRNAHLKDAVTMISFIKHVKDSACGDEFTLGKLLDQKRIENGCDDTAFDTICAYKENSAIVHYVADKEGSKKIDGDGFLLVDSGGQYRFEGTTDITRTISLGSVTEEEKKIYTTVLKGNLRLMDVTFPEGCEGTLLDAVAEQPLWERGYFCGHGIGHGVGCYLSVHESEARIARRTGKGEIPLRPGVIVSNEPGIYIEGRFGVRIENLLLVISAGTIDSHPMCSFVPLTLVPFDKEAIDFDMLDEKERGILKRYYELIDEKIKPLLDENDRQWLTDQLKLNI